MKSIIDEVWARTTEQGVEKMIVGCLYESEKRLLWRDGCYWAKGWSYYSLLSDGWTKSK